MATSVPQGIVCAPEAVVEDRDLQCRHDFLAGTEVTLVGYAPPQIQAVMPSGRIGCDNAPGLTVQPLPCSVTLDADSKVCFFSRGDQPAAEAACPA